MSDVRHFARRPMGYAPGLDLDRGQIFALRGERNDEKLLRLGYVAVVPPDAALSQCLECGREFVDSGSRDGHVQDRHSGRKVGDTGTEAELRRQDHEAERRERRLNEIAPLYFDKTTASQK